MRLCCQRPWSYGQRGPLPHEGDGLCALLCAVSCCVRLDGVMKDGGIMALKMSWCSLGRAFCLKGEVGAKAPVSRELWSLAGHCVGFEGNR